MALVPKDTLDGRIWYRNVACGPRVTRTPRRIIRIQRSQSSLPMARQFPARKQSSRENSVPMLTQHWSMIVRSWSPGGGTVRQRSSVGPTPNRSTHHSSCAVMRPPACP